MATSVPRYYTYIDFRADRFSVDTFRNSKVNGGGFAGRLSVT